VPPVLVLKTFTSSAQHQAVSPYDEMRLRCNSPQQILMPSNTERFLIEQLARLFVAQITSDKDWSTQG
jgi:hypothetical protein